MRYQCTAGPKPVGSVFRQSSVYADCAWATNP